MKRFRRFVTKLLKPFAPDYFYGALNGLNDAALTDFEKAMVHKIDRVHFMLCLSFLIMLIFSHIISFLLFIGIAWWFMHDVSHLKEPLSALISKNKEEPR
jgi:hypothetical protein